MRRGLIISSLILISLSLYGIIESSRLERTMKLGVGIAFFPLTMSIVIGVLALILLVGILKGKIQVKEKKIFEPGGAWRVFWVLIILGAYIFFMEVIGYFLSTLLFFFILVLFLSRARFSKILLTSTACTLLLYVIFRLWLKSPLPTGFLGI